MPGTLSLTRDLLLQPGVMQAAIGLRAAEAAVEEC